MLRKHMAACLVASALGAIPVLAQTAGSGSASPGSTTAQPGAAGGGATGTTVTPPPGPAGGGAGAAATGAGNINYITRREPDVLRGSNLIGMDIFGANNEDMGEVDDVLVNRSGQVVGLVLGVGGFLGIGETKIAVPMNAVQFRPRQTIAGIPGTGTAGTGGAAGGAGTMGTAGVGAGGTGTAGTAGMGAGGTGTAGMGGTAGTTGTGGVAGTGGAGTAGTSTAGTGATGAGATAGTTDVIVLMVTRDQLRAAPRFEDNVGGAMGAGTGAGPAGGGAPAIGTGTAPRQ
jgi:sporulation protein YlmC with PRC-barrel domain